MHQNKQTDSKYILSSLDNALCILNLFVPHSELSTAEISELSGINKSTVFRFLVTLENRGFLIRNEKNKYQLGLKFYSFGQLVYTRMELISIIHPYLEQLTKETGETSHLCILEDGYHIVFLDKALGTLALKMDTPLGMRLPAHLTGSGKAILAFESEQVINQYIKHTDFEPKTDSSIKSAKEFLSILDEIRNHGYACDKEEFEVGLTCYAVPILDVFGRPIAAISSSGPTTRMVNNQEQYIKSLTAILQKIQQKLI